MLSRFILGYAGRDLVDHKDGNVLDNRRQNLRVASRRQNALNRQQNNLPSGVRTGNGQFLAWVGHTFVGTYKTLIKALTAQDRFRRGLPNINKFGYDLTTKRYVS
jgi:hypothetical protein